MYHFHCNLSHAISKTLNIYTFSCSTPGINIKERAWNNLTINIPSPQPSPLGQGSQKQEKKVLPTPLSSPFESGEEEPTFSGRNKLKLII